MNEKNMESNLNTLKEIILDEQRLVTYISLSKELCIHVNYSKLLLERMVQNIRENHPDVQLNVNFVMSGLTDKGTACTKVCVEEEAAKLKREFKILFYDHIYSVNVGIQSVDKTAYISVNQLDDIPLCLGLIKNNICVKYTYSEINSLKSRSLSFTDSDKPSTNSRKIKTDTKEPIELIGAKKSDKINSQLVSVKTEIPSPTKDSKISDKLQFEPIIKTTTTSPQNALSENNKQKLYKKNHKTQKGIAGFFNKADNVSEKKENNNGPNKPEELGKKIAKKLKVEVENKVIDDKLELSKKRNQKDDLKVKSNKSSSSLTLLKKNAKLDSKRKRLLHVSDSESDSEKNDPFKDEQINNDESEDEIPPTPMVETVKITSGIVNPKKRRKIVDKTYTDEEGYVLTKKEEIYESCSENDEDLISKDNVKVSQVKTEVSSTQIKITNNKNSNKSSKKKTAQPQKGKQATLMNFFKKV